MLFPPARCFATKITAKLSGVYVPFAGSTKNSVTIPTAKNAYCNYMIWDEPGSQKDKSDSIRSVEFRPFDSGAKIVPPKQAIFTVRFDELPLKAGWKKGDLTFDGKNLTSRTIKTAESLTETTTIELQVSSDLKNIQAAHITTNRSDKKPSTDIHCDFSGNQQDPYMDMNTHP